MKKTVFYDQHVSLGGKMVPFAGYLMPVEFSGVKNEHNNVRTGAGVFDVSHMGEIWVRGKNAAPLVQRMTSNDVQKLIPGKVQYSCFPNGKGGIVDDLLVYKFDDDGFFLVVNASNTEKDWKWLSDNNREGAELVNASDEFAQLAVQGPSAHHILQKLTAVDLSGIPYYSFVQAEFAGMDKVVISNTGYTGAGGFELYFENSNGKGILEAILKAGAEYDLVPAGLAARDTLRLEMGFCLYGNDIDETTSPIEAGLGWITKFVDGNDFIDREYLYRQKQEGVSRRLAGFELTDRGIPRKDYPIYNQDEEPIGKVTSGTMSPFTSRSIGMGYLEVPYHKQGTRIWIGVRNKLLSATVVKPPFIDNSK